MKPLLGYISTQLRTKQPGDIILLLKAYLGARQISKDVAADFERLALVEKKHPYGKHWWRRYFNFQENLRREMFRIYKLQLHRHRPMKILDIGASAGVFVYMCKHFDHEAMGADLCKFQEINELAEALGSKVVPWAVRAMTPAPDFGKKFDLITAFEINFDSLEPGTGNTSRWDIASWRFFLSDIAQNLLAGNGSLFLSGVRQCIPRTTFFDRNVVEFFLSAGAAVAKGNVRFDRPPKV